MFSIDKMAASSPLRVTHPGEKAFFSLFSLLMVLCSNEPVLPAAVFLLMFGSLLWKGRVPAAKIAKLLLPPVVFLLTGLLPILVSLSLRPFDGAKGIGGGWFYWGISGEGSIAALRIFMKSFAGISCFYFLILTTPVGQIDYLAHRVRISPFLREMMILIYRYIFLLSELAANILNAQKIRYGYRGFGNSMRSMGMLCVSVLEKTRVYSDQAGLALEARGCEGECVQFLQPVFKGSRKNRVGLALFAAGLILLQILEDVWPILN